jgi:DNA-binding response OmpR family regulator
LSVVDSCAVSTDLIPKCVLIVDDDPGIRGLLRVMLRRQSFVIEEAANGQEALELIRARRHDAIVLDLMMGPGSGFDVLRELQFVRPGERCVVVLSASSERTLREADGPNIFAKIRKPFDVTQLIGEIRACCLEPLPRVARLPSAH